ncbi:hypothetical protein [Actinomadura montaniterrae]|uniref:Uncharacterized protein n=1 Tax=Actinomadura montaniterrae TaxID=1803903 RepID=A0A6L3VSL8_9ACTN|nr:hypothetical protein [Actinomadura montaniterrae]KAB2374186.1 hypothetical protein F9B16_27915 [Actinomadura montaniterrae]
MGYSESDEEFESLLRAMAAAEMRGVPPVAVDERAALKRFRRRLRAHRAAERRAEVVRHAAALRGLLQRGLVPTGGVRLVLVIGGTVVLLGIGTYLSLASFQDERGGRPGDVALGSPQARSPQPSPTRRLAGGRSVPIKTSLSGRTAVDGSGPRHTAGPPGAPNAGSPPEVAENPPTGTWIVKGKVIVREHQIRLEAEAEQVELTAVVSARNTDEPCLWSASAGTYRGERRPPTTDPTPVTFSIEKPTAEITLGVRHPPPSAGSQAGECVMTDITVKGTPVQPGPGSPARTPAETASPAPGTGTGGEEANRRRTAPTAPTAPSPTPTQPTAPVPAASPETSS